MGMVNVDNMLSPAMITAGIQEKISTLPAMGGSPAVIVQNDAIGMTSYDDVIKFVVSGQVRALSKRTDRDAAYADGALAGVTVSAPVVELANKFPLPAEDMNAYARLGINPNAQIASNVVWAASNTVGTDLLADIKTAVGSMASSRLVTAGTALTLKKKELEKARNKFGRLAMTQNGDDVCLVLMHKDLLSDLKSLQSDSGSPLNLVTSVRVDNTTTMQGQMMPSQSVKPQFKHYYDGSIEIQVCEDGEMDDSSYYYVVFVRNRSLVVKMNPSINIKLVEATDFIGQVLQVQGVYAHALLSKHPDGGDLHGLSVLRIPKS